MRERTFVVGRERERSKRKRKEHELLLGRTMIGERVWDVSRANDALGAFPEVDVDRVACMGNSGGGATTFYAACLEPRIRVAMPSCSVCTYRDSIFREAGSGEKD